MPSIAEASEIVSNDIDPEFLKSLAIRMGWAYPSLYNEIREHDGISEAAALDEFGRRRGYAATSALRSAAKQHGIPYEERYLGCNGQYKLLVKTGRVILMQEPILTLDESPRISEYKRELAESHGLLRQLELDLGDRPLRRDWSGCVLAVMLHGAAGSRFTQEQRELGALMLAVPDSDYQNWVLRLDLHSMAIKGVGHEAVRRSSRLDVMTQPDKVNVTLKRRNIDREVGS